MKSGGSDSGCVEYKSKVYQSSKKWLSLVPVTAMGRDGYDIPKEFLKNKMIFSTEMKFPILVIVLQPTTDCKYFWGCAICTQNQKIVLRSCCKLQEKHFYYVFIIEPKSLEEECEYELESQNIQLDSLSLEPLRPLEVKRLKEKKEKIKNFLPIYPFCTAGEDGTTPAVDLYYWFFLACLVSDKYHANDISFLDISLNIPVIPEMKELIVKQLKEFIKQITMQTNINFGTSFPLL